MMVEGVIFIVSCILASGLNINILDQRQGYSSYFLGERWKGLLGNG